MYNDVSTYSKNLMKFVHLEVLSLSRSVLEGDYVAVFFILEIMKYILCSLSRKVKTEYMFIFIECKFKKVFENDHSYTRKFIQFVTKIL